MLRGFFYAHVKEGNKMAGRKLMTVAEVVREYGLGERTVRRYIASNRLTAFRVGPRLIRLDADQVERELIGAKLGSCAT